MDEYFDQADEVVLYMYFMQAVKSSESLKEVNHSNSSAKIVYDHFRTLMQQVR